VTLKTVFDKLLTLPTELLEGQLPVLICAPQSGLEEPRKVYYLANATNDNIVPDEVSNTADNRRTTRSAESLRKKIILDQTAEDIDHIDPFPPTSLNTSTTPIPSFGPAKRRHQNPHRCTC
jgi:hypothetical protein